MILSDAGGGTYKKKLVRADYAKTDQLDAIDSIYYRTSTVKGSDGVPGTGTWTLPPTGGTALSVTAVGGTPVTIPVGTSWTEVITPTDIDDLKTSYGSYYDSNKSYYQCTVGGKTFYVCGDDLTKAAGMTGDAGNVQVRAKDTAVYYTDGTYYIDQTTIGAISSGSSISLKSATNAPTFSDYSYIGNCTLVQLDTEAYNKDATINVEIQQLLKAHVCSLLCLFLYLLT